MLLRPISLSLALLLTTAPVLAQTSPTPPAVTQTEPRETIEGTLSQDRTIIAIPALATASAQTVAGLRTDTLGRQIAEVIADPRVRAVSLTGSERAGAAVAEIAGRNLKKVVLELGGSDPFILLSGDVGEAVEAAADARLDNTGQSCNAAKRFIVADELYDEFLTGLIYLETGRPDFVSIQGMTDTPLALLSDEQLRPPPEVLESILATI
jgi:hypothetical protein